VKFIVYAQLPIALTRFLRNRGHIATHVFDVGLAGADDSPIWDRAIAETEVIVTKDEPFPIRRILTTAGPQVVWLRIGNCSNRALISWFDSVWGDVETRLLAGDRLIEVVCEALSAVEKYQSGRQIISFAS
jgi:predicted nuclease of predicted toxin-antitoxin system